MELTPQAIEQIRSEVGQAIDKQSKELVPV